MLSRVALRNGRSTAYLVSAPARTSSTQSGAVAESKNEERDLVNFPRPVRLENPGKVRMGFIPEEWFQFFYKKTGVTGPYTFGAGLTTYLLSKEIYIMEHEFYTGISIAIMAAYAIKKFGPSIAAWSDKEIEKIEGSWMNYRKQSIAELEQAVIKEGEEQERAKAQNLLFQAKRENVQLQLEAAYRERLMQVYREVKRRLDYQVETQAVERRFQQKHMVSWIVDSVRKSVTPEHEKQALNQCIASLKSMAAAQKA